MKQEFSAYLKDIVGLTDLFLTRAEIAFDFYQTLFPDDIKDIFVSEYIDKEGNRQFESIYIVTSNMLCEAKKFIIEEDFDFLPINNKIVYCRIKRTAFDSKTTSNDSRMTVNISIEDFHADFKASKENCKKLVAIFNQFLLPNLA